jgi:hypothetical protein
VAAAAELEAGVAVEAVPTPPLLKVDIEAAAQVIVKVDVGVEEVVGHREDVVVSADEDVDEDSRMIHRQRRPTQLLRQPTPNFPYFVNTIFPCSAKSHLLVHLLNGHFLCELKTSTAVHFLGLLPGICDLGWRRS